MQRFPLALLAVALLHSGCGPAPEAPPAATAGADRQISITVLVPADAPAVYLTGNLPALGPWAADALQMHGSGPERTVTIGVPEGHAFEYKFTLGSWDREGLGPSGTVMPNFTLTADRDRAVVHQIVDFKKDPREYIADWPGSGVLGRLVYWTDVESAHLDEPRHVSIWLPPGYDADPSRRYRVLYMSDGQNLFDPRIANTGIDWGVDEAMVRGAEAGLFEPAIVVGVWNSSKRLSEYSPWDGASAYARFQIEELMPRIDAEFRTLTGPRNTFAMGSSMGGLLSFYLVTAHPEHFGACGCVSTHFPLSEAVLASIDGGDPGAADPTPHVLKDIAAGAKVPSDARLFFDYGTEGLDAQYGPTHRAVGDWLAAQGLVEGKDFVIREYPGADHNEASWRARLVDALAFMLGPGGSG